jgi:hypothetical protein
MSTPRCTSNVGSSGPTLIGTIGVANFLLNLELAGQLQSHKDAQETHSIFVGRGRIGGKPKTGRKNREGCHRRCQPFTFPNIERFARTSSEASRDLVLDIFQSF